MTRYAHWLNAALALLIATFIPGCLEIGVKTTLNTDGSCDREITIKKDSKALPSSAFPIPVDSTWQTSWSQEGDTNKTYVYTARKHFGDYAQLEQEYPAPTDSEKLSIVVSAGRKFRWFYTYYSYRETFRVFNPLVLVPASAMLSPAEIQMITKGDKSDSLKKKYDAWEERNFFEYFYRALLQGSRKLNDPTLTPARIESDKEQLAHLLLEEMPSAERDSGRIGPFVRAMVRFYQTRAVESLEPDLQRALDEIGRRIEVKGKADATYLYAVVMPGVLLDTNSDDVKGTTASWKFESKQFSINDYEMWAESRVVNVWAFVVSALIALGLIAFLVLPRLRRQKA